MAGAEIALVRPRLIACLGATAAQALLGRMFHVSRRHGDLVRTAYADPVLATIHPSAALRAPAAAARRAAFAQLVEDLRKAAAALRD